MVTFEQLQYRHDNAEPPADPVEPSEAHFQEAFDQLLDDKALLLDFVELEGAEALVSIFQLIAQNGGLPVSFSSHNDRRDAELSDLYDAITSTTDAIIKSYRSWLGVTLADKAYEVMQAEIELGKQYARDAAFD